MDRNDAPKGLNAVAEAAQHVAAGLNKFLGPVSESKVDITALMAKCFEVSSSLHDLAEVVEESRWPATYKTISVDVHDVVCSLDHTFKDVHQIVGEGFADAKKAKLSQSTAYRKVWRNIVDHFQRESGNTLHRRLEYCRQLLLDLTDVLHEGSPRDSASFNDLAARVSRLLEVQEARLQKVIDWPDSSEAASSPGPSKKKPSFERKRPTVARAQTAPQPRTTSRSRPTGRRPSLEPKRGRNRQPPAPEVPLSDTSTDYSNDSFPSSASYGTTMAHWIQKVFERSPPSTKLSETGQPSVCLDEDNPRALDWLADEYVKLLEMSVTLKVLDAICDHAYTFRPFENGDLMVSFYLRVRDGRARFLCEKVRPTRQQKDCTIYLTSLDVDRQGQFLKFCRVSANQRSRGLWCSLRFRSYEQLVLFFCTFLALRSQDNGEPIRLIEDWRLSREEIVFERGIVDDQFAHRLMLLRDRDSGGIRLQASITGGEMKNMPVWTAFITHQIHSRRWMKPSGDRTVLLADLYRYIFDNDYNPPITPGGEHDLTFFDKDDADDFMDAIDDLADQARNDD